jgi:hypothetical protein
LKPNLVFRFRLSLSFSLAWPELNNKSFLLWPKPVTRVMLHNSEIEIKGNRMNNNRIV